MGHNVNVEQFWDEWDVYDDECTFYENFLTKEKAIEFANDFISKNQNYKINIIEHF